MPTPAAHLLGGLLAALQFVAVTGLGALLLRRCGSGGRPLRLLLWSALCGTVLLGLLVLALAALHLLTPLLLALLWLVLLPAVPAGWRTVRAGLRPRGCDWLALPCLLLLALLLAAALTPPAQYDNLVYHLAVPAWYLQQGGLAPLRDALYGHFPLLGSFTALPLIALAPAAGITFWFCLLGLLFPLSLELLLAGSAPAQWRWLLRWLLLTVPLVLYLLTSVVYDLLLAAMLFAAYDLWRRHGGRGAVLPCGLLIGGALSLKYTAALYLLPLFPLLLAARPRAWRALGAALLLAGLVLAPWLLRNWRDTGCPLAPFGMPLTAGLRGFYAEVNHPRALQELPRWWLELSALRADPLAGFLPAVALLLLLPAAVCAARRRRAGCSARVRRTWSLVAYALAVLALWLVTSGTNIRFALPAILLLCVAVIMPALARNRFPRLLRSIALAAGGLQVMLLLLVFPFMELLPAAGLGLVDDDTYLRQVTVNPCIDAIRAANALPAAGKVLFTGEHRAFYCTRPHVAGSVFDTDHLAAWTQAAASAEELRAVLRAQGISTVLYNVREAQRLHRGPVYSDAVDAAARERFLAFARQYLRVAAQGNGWYVFTVT